MKFYINKRLLEFNLPSFDYSKINNRHYFLRHKNALILNYYYYISKNLKNTIIFSKKISPLKWYSLLQKLELFNIIKKEYNLDRINSSILSNIVSKNKCKQCNISIPKNRLFCSNKCSSLYKSKDSLYIEKLSNSITKYHNNLTQKKKNIINNKIKESVILYNAKLTKKEKQIKYTNKIIRYSSFSNLFNRFPDLIFLFDEDFYYNNKYLPVMCKKCSFKWDMTKTTTISRTICTKCHPYNKHKTQTKIFDYINSFYYSTENNKSIISNELDIFVPELKFAVEYDGLLPHSFGNSKIHYYCNYNIDSQYHKRKTEECSDKNIQLYHIFEDEFLNKTKRKIWYSVLNTKMNLNEKIYARKCKIQEVEVKIAREFCENNHLQGYCNSSQKIGLFYKEELVSLMTFRKHKKYQYEIARFCSKLNTTIVGGASRLLKYFERNYNPESLISYANRRWSCGNLYDVLGFKFIHNTAPNYFYFKENENILYKREQFQKHKLKDILDIFDQNLSEIKNMQNNNYRIIYDCGNKLYLKEY